MSLDNAQIAAVDSAILKTFGSFRDYTFINGGATVSILTFFQQDSGEQQLGEAVVWMNEPVLTVLRSDVPNPAQGDTVDVDAIIYRVKDFVTDELTLAHMALERIT